MVTDASASADRRRVQRSAVAVGLWVGGASAAIVLVITAITVVVVAVSSRPEIRPGLRGDGWHERIVNIDRVVVLAVVLGGAGVVALAGVAWWAAHRAAGPLAQALRAQRDFVADAGHELRTPLTTLTSRIQIAQRRAERGGDVAAALVELRRDADALNAVLTDLLLSAETAGASVPRGAATSVLTAANDAVDTLQPRATAGGVVMDVEIPPDLQVVAEPVALTRAIVALLDNAVRHTPSGGRVVLTGRASGRNAEIRVVDEGTGITGIPRRRVFDRFARAQGDGDRRGFGLGLALVRDVATRFRGTVRVERTSPSGTTFLLTLPVTAGSPGRSTAA